MVPDFEDDDRSEPSVITLAIVSPESAEMYRLYRAACYDEALALAVDALVKNPSDSLAWPVYTACTKQLEKMAAEDALIVIDVSPDFDLEPKTDLDVENATASANPRRGMYRRFLESDYPAALELAEATLVGTPGDPMAMAISEESRIALHLRSSIPVIRETPGPISDTDPLALRVLSRIDGIATIGEIIDEMGVPPPDAQRLFEEFAAAGIIDLWDELGQAP